MINIDEKVAKFMELLGCDEPTAKQVIADDIAIDKGEKLFELTAEQAKVSKSARQGDRKPTVYKFETRQRKADEDKQTLIAKIAELFDNPTITNAERQIDFIYNGRKFRVVLSAPRS